MGMRYRFSFFLDTRRKIESGKYPVKVNLSDNALKSQKIFGIANVILNDGSAIELSCKDKKELDANQRIKMLQIALQYTIPRMKQATNEVSEDLPLFIE